MRKTCSKYIKAIVVKLDAFESQIIFEKNYNVEDKKEAITAINKFESNNNICQLYEMDLEI